MRAIAMYPIIPMKVMKKLGMILLSKKSMKITMKGMLFMNIANM